MAGEEEKTKVLLVGHSWAVGTASVAGEEWKTFEVKRIVEGKEIVESKRKRVPVVKTIPSGRIFGDIPVKLDVAVSTGSIIKWSQQQLEKKDLKRYDAIVIITGGNDILGRKAEEIISGLKKLYDTAKASGAKVFIFDLQPYESARPSSKQKVKIVNEWLHRDIPEKDLVRIPPDDVVMKKATNNWKWMHPTETGYRRLGEIIRSKVQEWLQEKKHAMPQGMVPAKVESEKEKRPIPIPA